MTSFRRAQSPPYHHQFTDPLSSHSPSYKPQHSLLTTVITQSKKLLTWLFLQKFSKKGTQSWKSSSSLYRFLIYFAFGFSLGLLPFNYIPDDVKPLHIEKPPLGNFIKQDVVLDTVTLGVETKISSNTADDFIDLVPRKQLILVTPTYPRALQAYFLHRLTQVLRLLPQPVLWIVVEMGDLSFETAEILRKSGLIYRHLVCPKISSDVKDRGVHQRNTALEHVEKHRIDGIVYFADDDNVYSIELFERLREISRFGTWPVAMLSPSKSKAILEGPVCNGSQVIGWHTNEKSKRLRRFHVDMSGFAFNSTILWDPKRWHRPTSDPIRQYDTVKEGFQETTFIEQVVEDESQMEAMPYDCLRVMNWHLHLEARNFVYPPGWQLQKNLDVVIPLH